MPESFRYRAFISYSHKDSRWADWLHRELEGYRVPPHLAPRAGAEPASPRRLRPVFRDRDELPSAASLPEAVHQALVESEALIVICSPDAARSAWVDDEIRTFRRLGRGHRIFCLIVAGEPHAGGERECFPQGLLEPLDPVSGLQAEPVAADARPGHDGRQRARLRLIAGLLGVGLDELLQRELHQRHRRMFAVAAVTSVIALAMAGLALFAFHEREVAERRRADAEGLVGFMLGDLREKLHEIGRLDLYSSVGDKSMEYFVSLGRDDARDEVLAQRARALRQIGRVRLDQGEMEAALEAFDEALAISRQLVTRDAGRSDWQVGLAESHFSVGYVHWQRGDLAAAEEQFMRQLVTVDALSASDPRNGEWLEQRAYAWTNYGRLLELRGQLGEARRAYQTVMDITRRLVELDPANEEWQLELGFAHNNLGKLDTSLGELSAAEAHFRDDLDIKQPISEGRPNHALWRSYLAVSHFYLGQVLGMQGREAEGRRHLRSALQIIEALLVVDPDMLSWHHRKANFERELSTSLRVAGEIDAAEPLIHSAVAGFDRLVQANGDNLLWQLDRGLTTAEAARQAALRGDHEAAKRWGETALATARDISARQPVSLDARKLEAIAWLAVGDAAHGTVRDDEAVPAWQAVLAVLDEHFLGSADPLVLDLRTSALARLERMEEARQSTARLEQIGYAGRFAMAPAAAPE